MDSLTDTREVRHPRDPGHALAAQHALHHLLRLLELLEQRVDLRGRYARSARDPRAPGPADDSGILPLLPGHGLDDGLRSAELALVDLEALERVLAPGDARQHREEILQGAELAERLHLDEEVLEREPGREHLLRGLGGLLLVQG